MPMNPIIITPNLRLADVVMADRRTLVLLPRFGIEMGFGDRSVEQVCAGRGIDVNLFILMVNIFLNPSYFPARPPRLGSLDLNLLLTYLQNSHRYYIEMVIPKLHELIDRFVATTANPAMKQLEEFFHVYIEEVKEHIAYEELTAFPYIQLMLGKTRGESKVAKTYNIAEFRDHHTDIEEKLSDLKNLLIKYIPSGTNTYLQVEILAGLMDLEEDLVNHARIEDKILIPLVQQIEAK